MSKYSDRQLIKSEIMVCLLTAISTENKENKQKQQQQPQTSTDRLFGTLIEI